MLKGFGVVYEKLIHEVKHLVQTGVVNSVQKRIYEHGVPNSWGCFGSKNVYLDFYFELQRVLFDTLDSTTIPLTVQNWQITS